MTTFVSDSHISHISTHASAYEYVTLTGDVARTGNTVNITNLSISTRVSVVYSVWGETQQYYISNSASSTAQLSTTGDFQFNFSDGPNHTESHSMGNISLSVGTSDTSKTLYLRCTSLEDNIIPFTVTFPAGETQATPTISATRVSSESRAWTITYGVSNLLSGNSLILTKGSNVVAQQSQSGTYTYTYTPTETADLTFRATAGGTFVSTTIKYIHEALSGNATTDTTTADITITSTDSIAPSYVAYTLDDWATVNYVAYSASGTTISLTGLTPDTAYTLKIRGTSTEAIDDSASTLPSPSTTITFTTARVPVLYGPVETYTTTLSNINNTGGDFACTDTTLLVNAILEAGLDPTGIVAVRAVYTSTGK